MADEGTGLERVDVGGMTVVVSRRDLSERDFDEHVDPCFFEEDYTVAASTGECAACIAAAYSRCQASKHACMHLCVHDSSLSAGSCRRTVEAVCSLALLSTTQACASAIHRLQWWPWPQKSLHVLTMLLEYFVTQKRVMLSSLIAMSACVLPG